LALTAANLDATIEYLRSQPGVYVQVYCPLGFVNFTSPWGTEIQVLKQV
jgi:hypothetical protein